MKNIFSWKSSTSPIFDDVDNEKPDIFESVKNLPKHLPIKDIIGIFILFAALPIAFIYEVTFILSFWYTVFSEEWFLRFIPLSLLAINAYLNIFCLVRSGPNGANVSTTLPLVLKRSYKYCHVCNINAPPRAHHCPVCNVCIYRRDHHCSFVGVCVGHFNQRFFIGAIINLWMITLICCYWNYKVLWSVAMPRLALAQIWHLMLPHMAFLFGFITIFQFSSIFTFVGSLVVLLFISYLIFAQFFCLWRGQTRVEFLMDVKAYDLGSFMTNISEALGERWPLLFLSPLFDTRLSSDGRAFRLPDRELVTKSIKSF